MSAPRPRERACLPADRLPRRQLLRGLGTGLGLAALGALGGCVRQEPLLRIATNLWPGYELLHLARNRGYWNPESIRLLELTSATSCIDMLAAATAEGATLTLDEVINARAHGLDLVVLAVLDVSLGADALLARPGIAELAALRGTTVGVERSAVGALLLDAALRSAGLGADELVLEHCPAGEHVSRFRAGRLDAVVSFEPHLSHLREAGAVSLFDSRAIPGRIIDVIAVLRPVCQAAPVALRQLLAGHFRARASFVPASPAAASTARRLGVAPARMDPLFAGLQLADVAANHRLFAGGTEGVAARARELVTVMQTAGLLKATPDLRETFNAEFLPATEAG